jgi:CDP-diglyceride synthetase
MGKRILTGAVALALFLPVLYYSDTIAFPATLGVLAAIAVYEFASCAGFQGGKMLAVSPVILIAAVLPSIARSNDNMRWLVVISLCVFVYLLFLSVFGFGKIDVTSISALFFRIYLRRCRLLFACHCQRPRATQILADFHCRLVYGHLRLLRGLFCSESASCARVSVRRKRLPELFQALPEP